MGLEEMVDTVLERAAQTGYRALLFLHGDRRGMVRLLAGRARGDCIVVADRDARPGMCRVEASPAGYERILGGEALLAVVSLPSMVRPSIIAAVGETVRGGGALAIVGGPRGEWTPGPREGLGAYEEYLYSSIGESRFHLWASTRETYSMRLPPPNAKAPMPERGECKGVPEGRIAGLVRTRGECRALAEARRYLRRGRGSLLLLGDRGRGKSYTLGLSLAVAVVEKSIGRASIVAPSPWGCQSVFQGLVDGLAAAGLRGYRVVRGRDGLIVRVSGSWFRVSYESPETFEPVPVVVVDEAAALGAARVRRIARLSGKTLASTTIHGYEGSGLVYARLVEKILPGPVRVVRLDEPVRYPPGDPLEEWIYETFMLRPEPSPPPSTPPTPGEAEHRVYTQRELAADRARLRRIMALLMQAHYRYTPDYLVLLLESTHHRVHTLEAGGGLIAVADLVYEPEAPEDARACTGRLSLYGGACDLSRTGRIARVSRIAVHPELQGRGYGSRLLGLVEEYYKRVGADAVGSVFSRLEVLGFWSRNGYTPYYLSPRYNRVTGEKNIAVIKPLHGAAASAVSCAACAFKRRLLLLLQSIYRDVHAETAMEILSSLPECTGWKPECVSTGDMAYRLGRALEGVVELEQAWEAVYPLLLGAVYRGDPREILGGDRTGVGLLAWVLQGKPLSEAERISGVEGSTLRRSLRVIVGRLLGGLDSG